jgi:hypothetical protein
MGFLVVENLFHVWQIGGCMKHVWIVVNGDNSPMLYRDGEFWNGWPCNPTAFTSYESARNHLRRDNRIDHGIAIASCLADRIVRLDIMEE